MKNKLCVISLTYNRPEYIKKLLEELQKKFKFNLIFRKKNLGVAKNFYLALKEIPNKFNYYLKFDSDVEILTDSLIKQLFEVIKFPKVGGINPRVEGVYAPESFLHDVEFYNGHAIRTKLAVTYGCCMLFPRKIKEYKEPKKFKNEKHDKKWGIDARLSCIKELE